MVKLELNLPWKPVLAWPWGVRYDIDPATYLITSHVESWDIEPWEVSRLFGQCSFNFFTVTPCLTVSSRQLSLDRE